MGTVAVVFFNDGSVGVRAALVFLRAHNTSDNRGAFQRKYGYLPADVRP
jgi:hypothetical protein